jgi:hypothetical protein
MASPFDPKDSQNFTNPPSHQLPEEDEQHRENEGKCRDHNPQRSDVRLARLQVPRKSRTQTLCPARGDSHQDTDSYEDRDDSDWRDYIEHGRSYCPVGARYAKARAEQIDGDASTPERPNALDIEDQATSQKRC